MADGKSIPEWHEEYQRRTPKFKRLASEVEFTLESAVEREQIKIHSVMSRVKSAQSIADKAKRKEFDDPLAQVEDIVGVRVVALFLSDLPRLEELIQQSFDIHVSENKITGSDPASFGYMSVHYLASFDDRHSGARYDDLKDLKFEIQTRTVVMDAWANVSHHLDYKGSSSIPEELRKDFFALSGLFYVADQHFEIFADRAQQSQSKAREELHQDPDEAVEINLDTVQAYLIERYEDRRNSDRSSISEFVEEITKAGYSDIGHLARMLDQAESRFFGYERKYPPGGGSSNTPPKFADLGAARITLALADRNYASVAYEELEEDMPLLEFALWAV